MAGDREREERHRGRLDTVADKRDYLYREGSVAVLPIHQHKAKRQCEQLNIHMSADNNVCITLLYVYYQITATDRNFIYLICTPAVPKRSLYSLCCRKYGYARAQQPAYLCIAALAAPFPSLKGQSGDLDRPHPPTPPRPL